MKKIIILIFATIVVLSATSCMSSFEEATQNIASNILPKGYKSDIKQGSEMSNEQIKKLKFGMSKTEVKNILGSADIVDPFRKNRWDYINKSRIGDQKINKNLILFFDKNNKLIKAQK